MPRYYNRRRYSRRNRNQSWETMAVKGTMPSSLGAQDLCYLGLIQPSEEQVDSTLQRLHGTLHIDASGGTTYWRGILAGVVYPFEVVSNFTSFDKVTDMLPSVLGENAQDDNPLWVPFVNDGNIASVVSNTLGGLIDSKAKRKIPKEHCLAIYVQLVDDLGGTISIETAGVFRALFSLKT